MIPKLLNQGGINFIVGNYFERTLAKMVLAIVNYGLHYYCASIVALSTGRKLFLSLCCTRNQLAKSCRLFQTLQNEAPYNQYVTSSHFDTHFSRSNPSIADNGYNK